MTGGYYHNYVTRWVGTKSPDPTFVIINISLLGNYHLRAMRSLSASVFNTIVVILINI